MSYLTQAEIVDDTQLRRRVVACAALEGLPDADAWAHEHRWQLSAQPGWATAYVSAITAGLPAPGKDESVITDAMILAAVQAIRGQS